MISAKTADRDLVLYSGPVVPAWGGTGSAPEDLAGKPGRGYAKILEELWTEVAPTAAYWNPTVLREDTRIPALGRDISEYDFLAPSGGGAVQIEARLLFRRAFRQLFQWKQWNDPDILMNRTVVTLPAVVPGPAPLAIVHGATKRIGTALAPDSIATVYGSGLQDARVAVRDQDGRQADARLLYVSAGQINLVLPPGLASGPAVLTVTRSGEPVAASELTIAPAAPGLFTAGGAETGPAAAMVVSVGPDGSQSSAPVSQCDAARSCVAVPITIHPSAAKTYLMLFGTGIRGASKTGVTVRIAGVPAAVLSAGPQSQFAGLDQVNVELPLSLAGRGEVPVDLSCDGLATNMVWIHVR